MKREAPSISLAAPTGMASKRMTASTGREARTIHKMFDIRYDLKINEEAKAFVSDVVVLDEVSMLDIDIGIAAQSMMLAAVSEGLGGCMIGSFHRERTDARFAKDGYRVRLVLALGVPVERVVLEDACDGDIHYYREPDGTHRVPKLPLDTLIIK